jgi:hypothetical protein
VSYTPPNYVTITFYRDAAFEWPIMRSTVGVFNGTATLDRPAPSEHWLMIGNLSSARAWKLCDSTGRVIISGPAV